MAEKKAEAPSWDSGLDLDTVMRVASNGIDKITERPAGEADAHSEALRALAKSYLAHYEQYGAMICDEVFGEAFRQLREATRLGEASVKFSHEFVCGRALAVSAVKHAQTDIDLVNDDFVQRATECLRIYQLAPVGEAWEGVPADRVVGADMSEKFTSAQYLTGALVKEWVEEELGAGNAEAKQPALHPVVGVADKTGGRADGVPSVDINEEFRSAQSLSGKAAKLRVAEDLDPDDPEQRAVLNVLTEADYVALAKGLMDSYRNIDIDYADMEWIDEQAMRAAKEKSGFAAEVESCRDALEREERLAELEEDERARPSAAR